MKTNAFLRIPLIVLSVGILGLQGCKEDPPPPVEPPTTDKVIVINEGLETSGTGSVSLYDPLQKSISHNAFYKSNTYVPGNGLYSIYVDGDRSFLVVGGTGEILVVNTETMALKKRISGLGAPKQMLKISENKFYVTDWQENGIWVLNVNTGTLKESIETGIAPENMAKKGNLVFVANSGGPFVDSTVTVIHAVEDTLMGQIQVAHNPKSVLVDDQKKLWVLCSGYEDQQNPFNSTPGFLIKFDLSADSLEFYLADSLALDTFWIFTDNQLKPQDFIQGGNPDIFYFLDASKEANLMRFDRNMTNLPLFPFIAGSFNAVGFDQTEKTIYLSDPGDGISPGTVFRFNTGGTQTDARETGIAPVDFGFR